MNLNQLLKNLKLPKEGFPNVKVALLGDSATQLLAKAIIARGLEYQLDIQLFEADYDQIEMQIFDVDSDLYRFDPEYILIYQSTEQLLKKFQKIPFSNRNTFHETISIQISTLWKVLFESSSAKVFQCNFIEINDSVFGNYANKLNHAFLYQLRQLNVGLMELAQQHKGAFILDLLAIQTHIGYEQMFDSKFYINAAMTLAPDALPEVAAQVLKMIAAMRGSFKKCLILDLDNTTWGGVIGDDGLEKIQIGALGIGKAFTELQLWAKALQERGIILAICSKNTENIAKEPFEKHPDMVLRLEDISIFVANWENKADNIRYIQSVLNIGFDSMVFLDDNPFERNLVREQLPQVTVPKLPEDPAEYLPYLRTLNLFETASYSSEDVKRTVKYQQEAQRAGSQKSFSSIDDYLKNLNMQGQIESINAFNTPRVAQLTQRSNQFNLRTIRYTEEDITRIVGADNKFSKCVSLKDRFGDYGLISVLLLEKSEDAIFIDTWIMSCRVLKRGVEHFVLNHLVELARQKGCKKIIGEYIPTPKNGIVKDHYKNLGFKQADNNYWHLDLTNYTNQENYINAE